MSRRPTAANEDGLTLIPRGEMTRERPDSGRERGRWIYPPNPAGWNDFALSEWVLERAGAADRHPHTETNIVVEGELHVQCQGKTIIAYAGDTVTVPAGEIGRYWTPTYARMFAIYGPSAGGAPPQNVEHWDL